MAKWLVVDGNVGHLPTWRKGKGLVFLGAFLGCGDVDVWTCMCIWYGMALMEISVRFLKYEVS